MKALSKTEITMWVLRPALSAALGLFGCMTNAVAGLPAAVPLASFAGNLTAPARIVALGQSNLMVCDPLARSIVTMDTLGRELATHRHSGQPLGLAVGADGRIYLGDADNGSVTVYDAQWHQLQQLGQGVGEFQMPGHIALLMNGATTKVFVSDGLAHRVKAYRNGLLIGQYGSRGQGPQQLDFPTGLWVSADRQLFVVDQNNDRVQVLDENGNFLRWFGLTPATSWSGRSGRAQGIMGDGLGRLYVADTFQGHIKVFDLNGDYLGLIGGFGNGFGQMQSPAGLALDLSGRLWVANLNGPSVQGYGLECFQHLAVSPVATTTSVGSTVTLAVTLGCGGPADFQWYRNGVALADGGSVTGATNATLSLLNVGELDGGAYTVAVTNTAGVFLSLPAQITIVSAPLIFSNPGNQTVIRSGTANFSVVAQGNSLAYQWLRNGAEVVGATQSTLQIVNVQSYEAGAYSCRVTNAAGTVTSSAATLTVLVPPNLTEAPTDQIVPAASTVTLSASAIGTTPLSFQWYRNNISISGQTRSQMVLSNVTSAVNGTYLVRVANSAGAATASFKFAVNSPTILTNSVNANGNLVLVWNNPFFVLQSASDWTGPWLVISPTSPYTVTAASMRTNSSQYFRLWRQ